MPERTLSERHFAQSGPQPQTGRTSPVIYTPRMLKSLREICEVFGVGPKTVKNWVRQKAPIAVEGDGKNTRYGAELMRVQAWRESRAADADVSAARED